MAIEQNIDYKYNKNIIESGTSFQMGNTGLEIAYDIYDEEWEMNFKPENFMQKILGKEIEFGLRYVLGVDLLVKWFQNTDFEKLNIPKPTFIYGLTNNQMHDYRKSLFNSINPNIYIERPMIADLYSSALDISLLYMELKNINESSKFAKRLKQAKELFE